MRQSLAILLVIVLVGSALADIRSDLAERRRKEAAKKYDSLQRLKSMDPANLRSRMDFENIQEEAKRAQRAGVGNLREKFNSFKAPNADQLTRFRNRMAAGGAKMAAQMNLRNGLDMKTNFRKSAKRRTF